jgi:DNA-binding MarR family transcriptional regulator
MGSKTNNGRETQAVLDAVRRIVQALRESSRLAERQVGLSGAQLFVLQKLAETPAISVNELAARTHTHQSSVSTVVARLVALGLVQRKTSDVDARSVQLSLSADGRRVAGRAPDVPQDRLIRAIEQLKPARRRQLASALGEVAEAMVGIERVPSMFFEESGRSRRRKPRA